jgi:ribosomal subunit interface protein
MKIKILAKEIILTNQLEDLVNTRIGTLDRLLKKDTDISCDCTVGKNSNSHKHGKIFFAEAKIKTANKNYGARAEGETPEEVIDELKNELSKKITRYKDKSISLRNKGGRMIKNLLKKISRKN